jgi:hypothetical protein
MMFAGCFVLRMGVGLEGGTVPVYVAECGTHLFFSTITECHLLAANPMFVPSRIRGNLVTLYQLNLALGDILV